MATLTGGPGSVSPVKHQPESEMPLKVVRHKASRVSPLRAASRIHGDLERLKSEVATLSCDAVLEVEAVSEKAIKGVKSLITRVRAPLEALGPLRTSAALAAAPVSVLMLYLLASHRLAPRAPHMQANFVVDIHPTATIALSMFRPRWLR